MKSARALKTALEKIGAVFLEGTGVRLVDEKWAAPRSSPTKLAERRRRRKSLDASRGALAGARSVTRADTTSRSAIWRSFPITSSHQVNT